jgi:hypothetical protein
MSLTAELTANSFPCYCDFNSCFSCLFMGTFCAFKAVSGGSNQGSSVLHHTNVKAKLKEQAGMISNPCLSLSFP